MITRIWHPSLSGFRDEGYEVSLLRMARWVFHLSFISSGPCFNRYPMPEKNGLELMEYIRSINPTVRTII